MKYRYEVPVGGTVWTTLDSALVGFVDNAGSIDCGCCVIDRLTGEIVWEPGDDEEDP